MADVLVGGGILFFAVYGLKRWISKALGTMLTLSVAWGVWGNMSKGLLAITCIWLILWEPKVREGDSRVLLVLSFLLGALLVVTAGNWVLLYLALELQTLVILILVANKGLAVSTEAGLKYLIMAAVASGFFLIGCALLYGMSGEMGIPVLPGPGVVFLIVSLLFKLTVAPFHMWALDIYEGASTPTIALLATLPKIAVFFLLVQVGLASNLVLSCACVSTIGGAVGALNQAKMKRMLAYSGVSHQGFIVLGLGLGTFGGLEASATYLPIYLVMCVCLFSAVCVQPRSCLVELSYVSRENNVLAWTLGLVFLSQGGVPPLAGFLGKWWVLLSTVSGGYLLIGVALVGAAVIAGFFYVRVVRLMYFSGSWLAAWRALGRLGPIKLREAVPLGASLFLVLFLMGVPSFLLQLAHDTTTNFYL